MILNQLNCLIAVAKHVNFAEAAKEKLRWHYLYDCPLYAVVNDRHPLAGEKTLSICQLMHETLIFMSRKSNPGCTTWSSKSAWMAVVYPRFVMSQTTYNRRYAC